MYTSQPTRPQRIPLIIVIHVFLLGCLCSFYYHDFTQRAMSTLFLQLENFSGLHRQARKVHQITSQKNVCSITIINSNACSLLVVFSQTCHIGAIDTKFKAISGAQLSSMSCVS